MQFLTDPAILFFALGLLAGGVRSSLEIPPAISRFLSLYLLMALGLKGGYALSQSGLTPTVAAGLACAVALALIVPLAGYLFLRRHLPGLDAAAVAATYGSVSAVCFIAATQYLSNRGMPFGGHMAAAMAMMESPAILLAVFFAHRLRQPGSRAVVAGDGVAGLPPPASSPFGKLVHEAFTDGTQLMLLGALLIGVVGGEAGHAAMQPFAGDLFKGMLAFFLLDMGLLSARQLRELRGVPGWLAAYALGAPLLHAALALGLALLVRLAAGDTALLMVLAASASYIAVPAALRYAIPEARPSLYLGMSLGLTFPFNILLGIPLYTWIASRVVA